MVTTVSKKEGVIIFKLSGRIVFPGIKDILKTVEDALVVSSSSPRLVFDFKEVTQIDSSGLGTFMKIYSDIYPREGKIAVINVNKHVKNLIVMARLITFFKNFESEDQAIAALSKRS